MDNISGQDRQRVLTPRAGMGRDMVVPWGIGRLRGPSHGGPLIAPTGRRSHPVGLGD